MKTSIWWIIDKKSNVFFDKYHKIIYAKHVISRVFVYVYLILFISIH